MNVDPQVVHHVYKSRLAASLLEILMDNKNNKKEGFNTFEWQVSKLPQSSELITAVPNAITVLSLTEDGAKKMKELTHFKIFLLFFDILSVEWVTNVFSSIVRVTCQRSHV